MFPLWILWDTDYMFICVFPVAIVTPLQFVYPNDTVRVTRLVFLGDPQRKHVNCFLCGSQVNILDTCRLFPLYTHRRHVKYLQTVTSRYMLNVYLHVSEGSPKTCFPHACFHGKHRSAPAVIESMTHDH